MLSVTAQLHGGVNGLQQRFFVYAGYDKITLVYGFGALSAGADANGWERMPHAGEKRRLLGQRATVAHHGKCVHLQAIVVVKTERFVLNHTSVELKPTGCKAVARARVATVKYRHIILLCHAVNGIEQREEVLLGVDVLLAVG